MILTLAGGVGAARMLTGLMQVVAGESLVAIVNVGDDLELHGLRISPDLDTITYTLAGAINPDTGWGLVDETWQARSMLEQYGGVSWFGLGDRDLGTHLFRTHRLSEGADLVTVTNEITRAWGLDVTLIPVTCDPLRTRVTLAADDPEAPGSPGLHAGAEVSFQEYFVQRHHGVPVSSIRFAGAALKGPADRLLRELGHEPTVVGVARLYRDLAATLVIDEADAASAPAVEAEGMRCVVAPTIMSTPQRAAELARIVIGEDT